MRKLDKNPLESQLNSMEPWKRVAFMLLCCERMFPNFQRFVDESGSGDAHVLRRTLDLAWSWIESDELPLDLQRFREACERQAPNTEDFNSPFTSAALDAANSAACLMDAIEKPDLRFPLEVAELARDTVDLFVQEELKLNPDAPDFEENILEHPLMQTELLRQSEDLATLVHWSGSRLEAARQLREKANNRTGSLRLA